MDTIQQVLDNDTVNPKWIGKVQYETQTILYPKTCKIILEKQPTEDEINTAKSNLNKTFRVSVDYVISSSTPSKINISGINRIDKPTIHVANPIQTTAEQLKPQFKAVVLKAVKAVNSSLTESDFDYFIESKGEDWPINITNDKTVEVQIEGKNNTTGQTNPIDVKIKNS
ncbi:hypothetical protein [Spiroplasma endosymbiont of Ammophila pubescens]|uniref:hypothetical protein n=1 Tax=Spiroplasma endosymbiont of Ammophila pubescens TaxID=3066315 RepID=UPI0032B277BD